MIKLYIDGLKIDNDPRSPSGAGWHIQTTIDPLEQETDGLYRLPGEAKVYDSELHAIIEGLQQLNRILDKHLYPNTNTVIIAIDNQVAIDAICNNTNHPEVSHIIKSVNKLPPHIHKICLKWTMSHIGIKGNKSVDRLANRGIKSTMLCTNTQQCHIILKHLSIRLIEEEWEASNMKTSNKDDLPARFQEPANLIKAKPYIAITIL